MIFYAVKRETEFDWCLNQDFFYFFDLEDAKKKYRKIVNEFKERLFKGEIEDGEVDIEEKIWTQEERPSFNPKLLASCTIQNEDDAWESLHGWATIEEAELINE